MQFPDRKRGFDVTEGQPCDGMMVIMAGLTRTICFNVYTATNLNCNQNDTTDPLVRTSSGHHRNLGKHAFRRKLFPDLSGDMQRE